MELSHLSKRIQPSPTMTIASKAAALRASGIDVIGLSLGEPDFDTPMHIKAAAIDAIQEGQTKYTPVGGTGSLKEAIVQRLKKDLDLDYEPEHIMASAGAKQAISNACLALLNPGDEVIIPAPYWVSYPDIVHLAGATPKIISCSFAQKFKITAEQLENAITEKTKLFILNTPSNPTGMLYDTSELKALAEVLKKHPHIRVISDDIYAQTSWQPESCPHLLTAAPELKDQVIVINGVSKAYAMTGWRLGYAATHPTLIKAMTKIQSQMTSCPSSISQAAAYTAIAGNQDSIAQMVKSFSERHQYIYERLRRIPGIEVLPSDATFYIFPNIERLCTQMGLKDDLALTEYLLDHARVAVVPGSAFGAPGHIRLSFAAHPDLLTDALNRIEEAVQKG